MQQYSIGLVLSGGGHKGLVHAGVLQFLQEQKIEPQLFSGSSAGALISSLYAVGKSPREILEFFRSVNLFNVHHFSLAKNGLLNAEKFMVYLEQVFGELRVGDLPKEVYISATNIETAKPKIFSPQTKLKEAVAASCAFPGVFSPIMVEGKLYSDGGILNNFPAHVIQGRCDFVIGVNLDCGLDYKPANKFAFAPQTAWRAIEIMMSQNSAMQNRFCDWLINPKDVNQYSVFELSSKRLDAIFNLGYQTAKREFAKLNPSIFG